MKKFWSGKYTLVRQSDNTELVVFYDYMDARFWLMKLGWKDSVHYDNGHSRWWKNGKKYSLIQE